MLRRLLLLAAICVSCLFQNCSARGEELRVPAFTAYMLPDPDSVRISEARGVTRWADAAQSVNWYGRFTETGELTAKVELQLSQGATSRLRLTIGGKTQEVNVTGRWALEKHSQRLACCSAARGE